MPSVKITAQLLSRRTLLGDALSASAVASLGLGACGTQVNGAPDTGTASTPDAIPSITSNDDFYVTSCCGTPSVDPETWAITFHSGDTSLGSLDLAWLTAQATQDREHTLECIGGNPYNQAISNAVWSGLPLRDILASVGVTPPTGTVEIIFTGADGYTTSVPVADLDLPIWLVWRMNGEELPPDHGYPARLLVPGRYGTKNPKWIVDINFSDVPYTGYWEYYGWSNDATYRPNTYVMDPDLNQVVAAGPVRLQGTAFAGSDPIASVEVSVDGGGWQAATLDYNPGADIWTLWHFDWDATVGTSQVQVRCTTAAGLQSDPNPEGTGEREGYNGSMALDIEVI
jgi:DMSO/TMAO reductase YedYZ molybdopterin-dependent catalytic subunit